MHWVIRTILGIMTILWMTRPIEAQHASTTAPDPLLDRLVTRLSFDRFTNEQGLSNNSITTIFQDHFGFLWIGTEDGINCYDGFTFKKFVYKQSNPHTLLNQKILTLCEDRDGNIWFGTYKGLGCLDRVTEQITVYQNVPGRSDSLVSNEVSGLLVDRSGVLWVGTSLGLCRFDSATRTFSTVFQPVDDVELLKHTNAALCEDRRGGLWFGLFNCLYSLDPQRQQPARYPIPIESGPATMVLQIQPDPAGNLWVATSAGLFTFAPSAKNWTPIRFDGQVSWPKLAIAKISIDPEGVLWCQMKPANGLIFYHPQTGAFRWAFGGLQVERSAYWLVQTLFQDRSGVLWIGTSTEGLFKYAPKKRKFAHIRSEPGKTNQLNHNLVRGICESVTGDLWVATQFGGLNRWNRRTNQWQAYGHRQNDPHQLNDTHMLSVLEDRKGRLWVGGAEGLWRFDAQHERFIEQHPTSPPDSKELKNRFFWVWCLLEDRAGNIWSGWGNQLWRLDPETGKTTFFPLPAEVRQGAPNLDLTIQTLMEDTAGLLWIGLAESGVLVFDPQHGEFLKWHHVTADNPNGLRGNFVTCIYEDRKGQFWVTTKGGGIHVLCNRNSTVFEQIRENNELVPHHNVYCVLEAADGALWFSSDNGLMRYTENPRTIKLYAISDGLQSQEFNRGSGYQSRSGEMFFGGVNGFNTFFPEQMKNDLSLPPVVLTDLRVHDRPVRLKTPLPGVTALQLPYFDNTVTFEFAALDFTAPERTLYQYRMEGLGAAAWIGAAAHQVTFNQLPPGDYVLQVRTGLADGAWDMARLNFHLTIVPPWWRTGWAYAALILVGLGSLVGGMQWRLYRWKAQTRKLEAKVAKRTQELVQAVDRLQEAQRETEARKSEVERKNKELDQKISQLEASQKQADRIFSALAEALPGTVLDGKYRLEEKIGSGGFGVVFRGTQLVLERPIAVKVFRPAQGNDSADAVERFRREGISAARLRHPNAIAILDSGISQEGIAYLVMELLEGYTLADEMRVGRGFSLQRIIEILVPVCDALAAAHALGIIHRDIKPDNIFLHQSDEGETVKVVDFGLAKLVGGDSGSFDENLTRTGAIVGTPSYIAPERLSGKDYGDRSDVYSLGIMFYEMVCGRLPFQSQQNNVVEVILMHLNQPPPSIRTFQAEAPVLVEELILSLLAKKPLTRPSVKEVAEFLRRIQIELPPEILQKKSVPVNTDDAPTAEIHSQTLITRLSKLYIGDTCEQNAETQTINSTTPEETVEMFHAHLPVPPQSAEPG